VGSRRAAEAKRWVATIHVAGSEEAAMRRKNWRIVIAGLVLIVIALVFFFFMLSVASKSNDPVALMQTVGTVAGAVGGISLVMIIIGLIGKRV
jgi:lipopolysaccharide/colanic/teichoic acid biosynthesis glycosyltransferase